MMIVVVEKNLYHIKQYLDSVGKYEIYDKEEYIGPIHACIYSQDRFLEEFEVMQNSLINLAQGAHADIKHGVLMINAQNKTPREIDQILSERLYNNIF